MPLFDAAAVEPAGENRFRCELVDDYTVFGYPNGGYLQCVMANAAVAAASDEGAPHLFAIALSTNFIKAPTVGPAMLSTKVRRIGRGASFVTVALSQGEDVLTEALVTVGTLSERSATRHQSASIDIAPLAECVELPISEGMTIHHALEMRFDTRGPRWWEGEVGDAGDLRAWIRLNDGSSVWDAWNVLFATDALPPATLPLGSTGWVPSLQLTSYVRRIPSSEWLHVRQWIVSVADGFSEERCEIYDDRGELIASASQLAMVRFTTGH
jgi:acyl-coenzyme A thioesterase PaaI-like protein